LALGLHVAFNLAATAASVPAGQLADKLGLRGPGAGPGLRVAVAQGPAPLVLVEMACLFSSTAHDLLRGPEHLEVA
jgi:hypothetical protein